MPSLSLRPFAPPSLSPELLSACKRPPLCDLTVAREKRSQFSLSSDSESLRKPRIPLFPAPPVNWSPFESPLPVNWSPCEPPLPVNWSLWDPSGQEWRFPVLFSSFHSSPSRPRRASLPSRFAESSSCSFSTTWCSACHGHCPLEISYAKQVSCNILHVRKDQVLR